MDPQAGHTLRKAENTSDKMDAPSMMRLVVPQNDAPAFLLPSGHPTPVPENFKNNSDIAPSSATETCLSLPNFLEARSDRAAKMSWELRPFSDYMAENPGLKSLWEKIEQFSLDINMEHFRPTLHYDEEWYRQSSKCESDSTASHGSGAGSQMAAAFKELKVETDGGSSHGQTPPSAIQGLLRRGAMNRASPQPIDSMWSSPGENQAADDFIRSSEGMTIPILPRKECIEKNTPKKRLAGQLDSEESSKGNAYLLTVGKKRRI
ncbi:MAG: hypothetical protein LQ337_005244 [Flavoplaca oasis]|nr:MAG: hypothetical protein LQ337_005244 [Flavoplaca oasis]